MQLDVNYYLSLRNGTSLTFGAVKRIPEMKIKISAKSSVDTASQAGWQDREVHKS